MGSLCSCELWFSLVAVVVAVVWILKQLREKPKPDYPRDTVILHQTGRGPHVPSLSPFNVKLETYLRLAKIPYQNVHDKVRGSKGKWPWIEYNGEPMPDSQLVIEHLNETRGVNLNSHLTEEENAMAVSLQRMIDEHTYWLMVVCRWNYDYHMTAFKLANWSWLKITIARWLSNRQTFHQGLGRHSKAEIMSILNKDFNCLSIILGNKNYLLGDRICEVDCSLFGLLSQFRWHLQIPEVVALFEKYPNLDRYCDQMKQVAWPDWSDCIICGTK